MQQAVSKRSSPSLVPPAKDMGGRERKLRDLAATAALNAAYDDRIQRERVQSKHQRPSSALNYASRAKTATGKAASSSGANNSLYTSKASRAASSPSLRPKPGGSVRPRTASGERMMNASASSRASGGVVRPATAGAVRAKPAKPAWAISGRETSWGEPAQRPPASFSRPASARAGSSAAAPGYGNEPPAPSQAKAQPAETNRRLAYASARGAAAEEARARMRETRDERTIRGAALDECREVVSMRDSQLHAAHMQLAELRATVSSQAAQLRCAGHEVQTLQSAAGFLEDRLRTAQAQEVASRTALRTLGGLEPVFEQLRGEFDCS